MPRIPDPLDVFKSINTYNQYYAVAIEDLKTSRVQCIIESDKDLAEMHRVQGKKNGKVVTLLHVHNYLCEYRKRWVSHMFVAYDPHTQYLEHLSDMTTVRLFIASHAMEEPGFSEGSRLTHEQKELYDQAWQLSDQLEEGDVSSMTFTFKRGTKEERELSIFRCTWEEDADLRIESSRLSLDT